MNHRTYNKITVLGLTFCLVLGLALPAYADTAAELEQKQREIQEQLKKNQALLEQTKKKEQAKLKELKTISANIITTTNELKKIDTNLTSTQKDIATLNNELAKTQNKQNQQTQYLNNRLNEIYAQGDVQPLEVLLNSTGITDFLTRWDFLAKVAANDVSVIEDLMDQARDITTKTAALTNKKNQLVNLQEDRQNKKEELQDISSREKTVLKEIQSEKEAYEAMEQELLEESNRIAEEIRKLQNPDEIYRGSGKFYWPVPGYTRITSSFGPRIHPIYKSRSNHTGIDLAVPSNTNVHAAEIGRVMVSGWNAAYGYMIILNHGGQTTTLYGHLNSLSVSAGQEVKKGQVIGCSGSTGWSTGPHLHFEVRKNGNPVNPLSYLR